ncbi:MAG: ABC transporter ATP-binding protein [Gemmatimonadaceae bacterium]|nr:ABC transporter ATP-binding protein [Gemmatimonadaceae bacterium]
MQPAYHSPDVGGVATYLPLPYRWMSSPATLHEEDALARTYDARLMRRLLKYVRPYKALVAAALALLLIEGVLQLAGPLLTRQVIDVALPKRDEGAIVRAAILFAVTLVAQFICSFGEAMLTNLLGQSVMRDLRIEIFAHLQRLSVAFFDRNPAGRLITRVTSDVETLNELFTSGVVSGLGDLFALIAIGVTMFLLDWRLSIAVLLVIPLVAGVSDWFRTGVRDAYRDIRTRLARINSFLQERITGMRIVQLFGGEEHEAERFSKLNADHLEAHKRSITVYAIYFPAIEVLTSVAVALLVVVSASLVHANTLTVGALAAFLQLSRRFYQPLQDLAEKFNILQSAMASSERIFMLLDTEPSTIPIRTGPRERQRMKVEVRFDGVWFAYDVGHVAGRSSGAPAEPEWVLKGVSFTAEPGRTLAIVGHTGAGKTTIVNLLMRFYRPQRGRILVNGVDIEEMPLDELRGLIAYVQQDIFLFAGDVATNIRLSNPLTDDEVAEAAAKVGADRIVRRLPGGYGQQLGERGASLSVGERQLLSFARAVAADASLLILDEATSAVDSEIEAEIQRALAILMEGRTTIAIAHRLSTIVSADEILVLHHGEVVERGTHEALLARGGLYERLWRLQSGEEILRAGQRLLPPWTVA